MDAHGRFVVGIAYSSRSVIDAVRVAVGPEVALLDVGQIDSDSSTVDLMLVAAGGGWRRTRRFLAAGHRVVLLATTRDDNEEYAAIEHGAAGYVVLEGPVAALRRTLTAALDGQPVFHRDVFGRWLRAPGHELTRNWQAIQLGLTPRQQQIALLIAEGATNKEIAGRLRIANSTVDKHVSNLLTRVGAPNRAAAVSALLSLVQRDRA